MILLLVSIVVQPHLLSLVLSLVRLKAGKVLSLSFSLSLPLPPSPQDLCICSSLKVECYPPLLASLVPIHLQASTQPFCPPGGFSDTVLFFGWLFSDSRIMLVRPLALTCLGGSMLCRQKHWTESEDT